RIPLPGSCALSVERCEVLRHPVPCATIRGDGAVFIVSATVIGIYRIEENEVSIGLDDPRGRAVPREPQRLARHDRIVLVRPLIEILNLVPELGFVNRATDAPKPRRRNTPS